MVLIIFPELAFVSFKRDLARPRQSTASMLAPSQRCFKPSLGTLQSRCFKGRVRQDIAVSQ